jgi:uncharacterized membrane protein YhaH (DUF805 family)
MTNTDPNPGSPSAKHPDDEQFDKRLAAAGRWLLDFSGRYGREKFWLGALGLLALLIFTLMAMSVLMRPTGAGGGEIALIFLFAIPFVWFYCKLIIHRLHDLGWSGWWFLLLGPILIPLPIWMWVEGHTQEAYNRGHDAALEFGAYAIFLGGFILMGCLRGTVGPNKYGPDPLAKIPPPVSPP